jgi:hypothetical protein
MRSIFSKAVIAAVITTFFALNVQASTIHMAADTGKMSKMGKMNKMDDKMGKKKPSKMKKGKMGKDTTKM